MMGYPQTPLSVSDKAEQCFFKVGIAYKA